MFPCCRILRERVRASTRVCSGCPLATRCRPSSASGRQLFRWEGEDVVDRHRARMAQERGFG